MSSLEMSQYAQVLFVNVPKNYPVGADVEVKYTITSQLQPTKADWLGVFKIGWCSASSDALHRVWIQLPEKYEPGQPANAIAVFEGAVLPKDTDEFYQFCYINSKGQVRGASTPFQFRRSDPDDDEGDFVEEIIEDMLVVTSKSAVLDEKLDLATEKIKVLTEEKLELVKDRQNLMLELSTLKKKHEEQRASADRLAANLEAQQLLAEAFNRNLVSAEAERLKLTLKTEELAKQNAEFAERELGLRAQLAQLKSAWQAARDDALQHSALLRDKAESLLTVEARYSAQLCEAKEQLACLEAAKDQLLVQFNRVCDDLRSERGRFADLEQTLSSSQAEMKGQQRQTEERLRSQLDAAMQASRGSQLEAAELRAKLEKAQGEDQRLRQALAASEEKIKELIGHNAALVEETGCEQEEAKQVSSALHAELAGVKARLAETESQLRQSQQPPPQGGGDLADSSLDSYHALLTAYEELKALIKERTHERDSLFRSERHFRSANSKLTLENRSLTAQLAAAAEECTGLRKESQLMKAAADKRCATCTGSSLGDSWVCALPTPAATTTTGTPAATSADDSAGGGATAAAEKQQRSATEKALHDQLAASEEYYISTLQQVQKDLQDERKARQELQQLLLTQASRCSCKEISDVLSHRPRDNSLSTTTARAASHVDRSTEVAYLASGSRDRRNSSDDEGHGHILEPPVNRVVVAAPRYSDSSRSTGRAMAAATGLPGPLLPLTDRAVVDPLQSNRPRLLPAAFESVRSNAVPLLLPPPPPPSSGLQYPGPTTCFPQPFLSPASSYRQQMGTREPSASEQMPSALGSPPTECCVCGKRFEAHQTFEHRTEHINLHFPA